MFLFHSGIGNTDNVYHNLDIKREDITVAIPCIVRFLCSHIFKIHLIFLTFSFQFIIKHLSKSFPTYTPNICIQSLHTFILYSSISFCDKQPDPIVIISDFFIFILEPDHAEHSSKTLNVSFIDSRFLNVTVVSSAC